MTWVSGVITRESHNPHSPDPSPSNFAKATSDRCGPGLDCCYVAAPILLPQFTQNLASGRFSWPHSLHFGLVPIL